MTLLEVLIVLGIMGLMMFLGFYTVRAVSRSELRSETVEIAAALQAARNLASQSGVHHRVVFDLEQQTYRVEACPDPIRLRRGADEEEKVDIEALERLSEQQKLAAARLATQQVAARVTGSLEDVVAAQSPEKALEAAAALSGVRVGTARCGVAAATGGDLGTWEDPQVPNVHRVSGGAGVKLRRVYVQHVRDAVTDGEVSVNFFPFGSAEKALLELADEDGAQFTVLLHGLTGRVEVRDGPVDPDLHMRRNAAGEDVDEP